MTSPSAGWFNDPKNPQALRFFDGEQWTHLVAQTPQGSVLPDSVLAASDQYMAQKNSNFAGQNSQFNAPGAVVNTVAGQEPNYGGVPGMVNFNGGDGAQGKPKTSKSVWAIILVGALALSGVVAFNIISGKNDPGQNVVVLGPDGEPTAQSIEMSEDFKASDVPSGFGCSKLGKEAIRISKDLDGVGEQLIKVTDAKMTADYRDVFTKPVLDPQNAFPGANSELAFECTATGEFDDGLVQEIEMQLMVNWDKEILVYSTPRR